jgi:predicted nucleic acid-binding protein
MSYLLDTNILLRWSQPDHPLCALAQSAVNRLFDRGEALYITPQNLMEFWNVATRPANVNGLGLAPADVDTKVAQLEGIFEIAPDAPTVYPAWRNLVIAFQVSGVQVHDARLVAVMQVHSLSHLLTFDTTDFRRFSVITAVHPQEV